MATEIYAFDVVAGNNNLTPPDGFPENMQYQQVNDAGRELFAKVARWRKSAFDGTIVTAGTSTAYTLTSGLTGAITTGMRFTVKAHATSTGPFTLAIDALGARNVVDAIGNQLTIGDWLINSRYEVLVRETDIQVLALGATSVSTLAGRTKLSANRTLFVRTDGNDGNDGSANDAAHAFLTVQRGVDVAFKNIDLNGFTLTIKLADGTYGRAVAFGPQLGEGTIVIAGNNATPANVILTATGISEFAGVVQASNGAQLTVQDLALNTVTSGSCVYASGGANIQFSNLRFGACAGDHILANAGASIQVIGNYTINGNALRHAWSINGSFIDLGTNTVTLTGTPAWTNTGFQADNVSALLVNGITWSGAATGARYSVSMDSVISAFTSLTQLPGNAAGVANRGGEYAFSDIGVGFAGLAGLASAATTDLGASGSHWINITGTNAISSFGSSADANSPIYLVRFNSTGCVIANSGTLIIPGGGSISAQLGDIALLEYFGAGSWEIIEFFPSAGKTVSVGQSNGLTITNNATTPTTKIDVAITGRSVLEASSGDVVTAPAFSTTIDATTTGVNGLDTGALAANTWYHVWLVSSGRGAAIGALLSLSATTPGGGFAYKQRIGAVRTGGASTFLRTLQKGNVTRYQVVAASTTPNLPQMASGVVGSTGTPTYVSIAGAGFFPPTATRWNMLLQSGTGNAIIAPNNSYGNDAAGPSNPPLARMSSNNAAISGLIPVEIIPESANVFWASNNASGAVWAVGWVDQVNAN